MKILVIGGTGKVGGLLVGDLVDRGAQVRVLTRSAERAAALPQSVEPAIANITEDPRSAAQAFEGIDAVFMLNKPTLEEMPEGLLAVHLARDAGVTRFVYQSIHKAEGMSHIPHVASKLAIEKALLASDLLWTFIRPNYFFQNDLTAKATLERGLFTQPIGKVGVASVDAADIAAVAATVLLEDGHQRKSYNVVGPDILDGDICASIWATALGRDVRYAGDVDQWQATTSAFMPAWFNTDLAMMYRSLGKHGMLPGPDDVAVVSALLKRSPRSYRDYVAHQAKEWGIQAQ